MPTKKQEKDQAKYEEGLERRIEHLNEAVEGHKCQTLLYRQCPKEDGGCGEWSCKKFPGGVCMTCYAKIVYWRDPEMRREKFRKWQRENPEKEKARLRSYYLGHREELIKKAIARKKKHD